MGFDVQQIHNLVRTYQRAFQADAPVHSSEQPSERREDSVSFSPEARERIEHERAADIHPRPEKGRRA